MCQRNACELGCGNRGAHAWNDLEWNTGHRERQRFLRAATENEWISALEPHDALARACRANHEPVNSFLPDTLAPRALAHAEALRVGESPQRLRVHERVIQHEICLGEICNGAPRPEIWISGPCADERHAGRDPGLGIRDPAWHGAPFLLVQAIEDVK